MKYKKSLLALILIACILFTVSSVAASNANDTAIASTNTVENDEPVLSLDKNELGDDALAVKKSDENTLSMKDVASDKEILSASSGKTVKSTATKNSAKTTATKQSVTIGVKKMSAPYKAKKYFKAKVVKTKTKKPLNGIPVNMVIYTGKTAKVVKLKSNAKGMIAYPTSKLSVGNHKVVLKVKKNKYYAGKAVTSVIKINKASKKVSTSIETKHTFTSHSYERVNYYYVGMMRNSFTTYIHYPYFEITPTLKAANGKTLPGKYKAVVNYYYEGDNTPFKQEKFTGKFGEYKSYSGTTGGNFYQLVLYFKGTSHYKACKFTGPMMRF